MFIGQVDQENFEFARRKGSKDKKKRKRRRRLTSRKEQNLKKKIGLGLAGVSVLGAAYGIKKQRDFEEAKTLGLINKFDAEAHKGFMRDANDLRKKAQRMTAMSNRINKQTGGKNEPQLREDLKRSLKNVRVDYDKVRTAARDVRSSVKKNNKRIRKLTSLNPFV